MQPVSLQSLDKFPMGGIARAASIVSLWLLGYGKQKAEIGARREVFGWFLACGWYGGHETKN